MLVTILHFHCDANKTSFGVLYDNLLKGIKDFPNNMLLLSTFSDLEVSSSGERDRKVPERRSSLNTMCVFFFFSVLGEVEHLQSVVED